MLGWGSSLGTITAAVARARADGRSVADRASRHLNPFPRTRGGRARVPVKVLIPERTWGSSRADPRQVPGGRGVVFEGAGSPDLRGGVEHEIARVIDEDVIENGGSARGDPRRLTKKEFTSDQEPRWCPGCGDYAICPRCRRSCRSSASSRTRRSSCPGSDQRRFTYYMDVRHARDPRRAPALATGIAVAAPELSVWVVTGDGDGLSIAETT